MAAMATQNRPHFGQLQVRTPAGVTLGNELVMVRGDGQYRAVIIVLSEPYVDKRGKLVFDLVRKEYLSHECIRGRTHHLADLGIVPNDNGLWNPANHLSRTGRRHLTPEEVEAIRSRIRVWR